MPQKLKAVQFLPIPFPGKEKAIVPFHCMKCGAPLQIPATAGSYGGRCDKCSAFLIAKLEIEHTLTVELKI